MILGHGDDIYNRKMCIKVNFSSNVYRHIDHTVLLQHLENSLHLIKSYPEPDSQSLAHMIADRAGTGRDSVIVTNGATEAIYLAAAALMGKHSAILSPTFAEYGDACTLSSHIIRHIDSISQINGEDEVIWICNPNNPTGSVIAESDLLQVIHDMTDKIFIIDQSYGGLTKEAPLPLSMVEKVCNLILIQSMTKEYGIPGLRIGYIASSMAIASKIKARCMPWSVNILASEAGKYFLDSGYKGFNIDFLLKETQRFRREIDNITGFSAQDTKTNFFLCTHNQTKSSDLKKWLLDTHGLLIRDASNFKGLDDRCFRIATQLPEENDLLINALKCWKSINI